MNSPEQFALKLHEFVRKTKERANGLVGVVVVELGVRLVNRSPVGDPSLWKHPAAKDYKPGTFKGSWFYGVDSPVVGEPTVDPSGESSVERVRRGVNYANAAGHVHYILNPCPYANRIENGWSTQRPHGVVALTVAEYQQVIDEAVRKL